MYINYNFTKAYSAIPFLRVINYASPSSGDAYSDPQLTTNFEL